MRSVALDELKLRVDEFVRVAASGETVLVTDRERVVAELVPPRPPQRDPDADAILEQGAQEGWYTPPETTFWAPLPDPDPTDDPPIAFEVLMRDLARDRDER